MSREIKFRWWNGSSMQEGKDLCVLAKNLNNLTNVMQFTGLFDKNGVEIYEGDIVSHPLVVTSVIQWDEDSWSIGSAWPIHQFRYNDYDTDEFEVIGNIHQHPELLESE